MNKKTILFVGAGIETIPGINLAINMGLHVVVSDKNIDAPGVSVAHDYLQASTYDIAETVGAARKYHSEQRKIDGVICLGTDVPMTVASVAYELGLPGISLESAMLASDKLAMKDRFVENDIAVPWYSAISSVDELRKATMVGGQFVIKPVDSRGARGVLRIDKSSDLEWAYFTAKQNSPTGRVMLERYLDGPQVSTESLVVNGVCYTLGFSDRNYEFLDRFAPHIIENGGELPSALQHSQCDAIRDLVGNAARALGVVNGVVKGDMVLHNGNPYVIELATRLSGGYFCTHEIPLNTGVDFVGAAISQCLGEQIAKSDLASTINLGVAQRYIFPDAGRVLSIEVPDWVYDDPAVNLFEIRVGIGDIVQPINSHPARAGVVITTGANREEAILKAEAVIRSVKISTTT